MAHSDYGETYHSTKGAITESRYVFLAASGVEAKLTAGHPTRVLEIGFGLGLNALLTADLAIHYNTPLTYHAFENQLVSSAQIERMGYRTALQHPEIQDQVLRSISTAARSASKTTPPLINITLQAAHPGSELNTVSAGSAASGGQSTHELCIQLTDAAQSPLPEESFDAIYLDAFSPDCNQECWSVEFLTKLRNALIAGGVLSTYSAKGQVRRNMQSAGLTVEKIPGPPGKREMLVAKRQ